jgi:tetratricopeptide (TPR) repeat protein
MAQPVGARQRTTFMRIGRFILAAALAVTLLPAQPAGQDLIDGGHFKRLRALVATRNATDPETLFLTAAVKHIWGDLDAAEKLAEQAVAKDPNNARYHYRLAQIEGEKAQKASVLHQLGLARRFKKEAETALALDPNYVRALQNMIDFYMLAPGIVGGDKAKAHAIAGQLMKIDPAEGYRAQVTLARYDKQDGRIEELLRKAVEARPDSYDVRMALGDWCANQKKFEEAERHAREAVRLHPDRAAPHGLLAAVLVQQDKWTDLDAALVQSEKADPDNLQPYFRAANNCLARKVELPRAERYLRKYLTQEPEPRAPSLAGAHWRLGLVLEQQSRKPEALAELQQAVKLDADSPAKADLKRLK